MGQISPHARDDGPFHGRPWLVGLFLDAVVVLCWGCGDPAGQQTPERSAPLEVEQTSSIGELAHLPTSPLSRQFQAQVAAGGQYLALVGGFELGDSGTPSAFSDRAAVYSLANERWDEITLPDQLVRPAAVWVGGALLVAGAGCSEPLPEDDGRAYCKDAPMVVQKYDVESQKWADISDGLKLSDEAIGSPTFVKAAGVTTVGAVFGFGTWTREYHLYNSTTGEWAPVASPPSDTGSFCGVDGTLYAIGAPEVTPFDDGAAPTEIRVYALQPDGSEWIPAVTHDPVTVGQVTNHVVCGANELAILPITPRSEKEADGILWMNGVGELEDVPAMPVTFPAATIADLNDAHVLFPAQPVNGAYSLSEGTWRDTGLQVSANVAYSTDSGIILSNVGDDMVGVPEFYLLRP